MKLAFFVDTLEKNHDGVSVVYHNVIEEIKKHGVEAIFFTAYYSSQGDIGLSIYKVASIPIPKQNGLRFAIPNKKRIFKRLDEFKPDLIHWSTPSPLGICALKYSKQRNIPNITVYHTHFSSYFIYAKWIPFRSFFRSLLEYYINKLYKKANLVLAPSHEMITFLASIGVDRNKIKIWGSGVNLLLYNPEKREKKFLSTYSERIKVLFVSRLMKYKRTDSLIAISHLLPKETMLLIVGDGPEERKLKSLCKRESTVFLGKLHGEELATTFASSDIFIFPSISETFGNVVLEAQASGLPVVAADEGGSCELVGHGSDGYLFAKEDIKDAVEKIGHLSVNLKKRSEFGLNARVAAESRSWKIIVEDLLMYYNELIVKPL